MSWGEGRKSSRSAECKCVWMSAWWNNLVRRPLIRDIVRMAGNRNQPVPPRVFSLRSRITPETGNSLPPCPVYSFNRSTLDFCQYLVGTRAYRLRRDRTLASFKDRVYKTTNVSIVVIPQFRRLEFPCTLYVPCTYTEANESLNGYAMNFNSFCSKSFLPHWWQSPMCSVVS